MYNVDKLEKQWKRYRLKKAIIPSVSILVIIVIATAVYFNLDNKESTETNRSLTSNIKSDKIESNKSNISNEQESRRPKTMSLETEVPSLRSEDKPKVGQIVFQDEPHVEKRIKPKKRKNLLIQVTERGGKDIAEDIENRFEFAKDKSDSLFLAKYYYDKMEYAKAEKWAFETNKLDSNIEESWLIFAKAQAKQGKRIDALKVLNAYIEQTDSRKAKVLMDKIRRGKSF